MDVFDFDEHPTTVLDEIARQLFEEDLKVLRGFNTKHHDYYMELILRTPFLPHHALIKERFWHLYNRTVDKPLCLADHCMTQVTWHPIYNRNNIYCSKTCSKTMYWVRRKRKEAESSNS